MDKTIIIYTMHSYNNFNAIKGTRSIYLQFINKLQN